MADEELPPSFEPGTGRRIPGRTGPSPAERAASGRGTPTSPRPGVPARPPSGARAPEAPTRAPLPPRQQATPPGRAPFGRTTPAPGRTSTTPGERSPGSAGPERAAAEPLPGVARPIPVQRPASGPGRPTAPARGSRTDPAVGATRAVPLSGAAPGRPGVSARPGGAQPVAAGAGGNRPTVGRPLAGTAGGGPGGPGRPATTGVPDRPVSRSTHRRRRIVLAAVIALVLLLAWPVGLLIWANGRIQHVEALSGAAATPGVTYLLAGSDSRADGAIEDTTTTGQRTDTIMLLTAPANGTPSLVSLPRDTYVDIPGVGPGKLNAAFAYGGAPLLVQTVEQLTGITVDHYVEVGMGGVVSIVDGVGGVELCWDSDVDDVDSGMVWTAGCHEVNGTDALAFARMRKSDPTGDIGRGQRQQQVIQAVMGKLKGPSLLEPGRQLNLVRVATDNLVTDPDTGILALGRMALTFRNATGPGGFRGAPPIADSDYRPGDLGSTVLLDEAAAPVFWQQVLDGTLPTQTEQEEQAG